MQTTRERLQTLADDLYARGRAREYGWDGVAKNTLKAVDHYADAAKLGHKQARSALESLARDKRHTYAVMRACIRLARLYVRGRGGVARDFVKAAALLVKAEGHAITLQKVGERSLRMLRLRALVLYRLLARAGDAHAQRFLGASYLYGWGVTENPRKALAWLGRLAKRGGAHARKNAEKRDLENVAELAVQAAKQAEQDPGLGAKSLRMLRLRALVVCRCRAKAGDADAVRLLSEGYRYGWGVRADDVKARGLLTSHARRSGSTARDCVLMGEACEAAGFDVEAVECFQLALKRRPSADDADRAYAGMGRMCEYGRGGMERSDAKALEWHGKRRRKASAAELFWRGALLDPARDEGRKALLELCRGELLDVTCPTRHREPQAGATVLPARYADGLDMLERVLKEIPQDQMNGWAPLGLRFGPDGSSLGDVRGWRKAAMLNMIGLLPLGKCVIVGDLEAQDERRLQQSPPPSVGANDILENAPLLLQGLELLRLRCLQLMLGNHLEASKCRDDARKPLRIALAAMVGYAEDRRRMEKEAAGSALAAQRLAAPLHCYEALLGAREGDRLGLDFDMMADKARSADPRLKRGNLLNI